MRECLMAAWWHPCPPWVPLHRRDIKEKEMQDKKLLVASPGAPRDKDNRPVEIVLAEQEQPEQQRRQQQRMTVRKEPYIKKRIL